MTVTTQHEWHIIGRGFAGWHAAGVNVSSSGGDIEPRTWWADGSRVAPYHERAIEGAAVYDASEADETAFRRFVIAGPMVNPALPPYSGPERPGSLDYVDVTRYIELMRAAVPRVRFGTVRAGEIVWES